MNTHTKESNIKFMVQAGVNFVVHGSSGYGEVKEVLFLDDKDLVYKPLREITNEEVLDAVKNTPCERHYELSRKLAIDNGNAFAIAHPQPIVEE